jgi:xanthine dehydrogenase small subunit
MAAVAARAPATERALIGAVWSEASIDSAVAKLAEDFKPLTDMRASSAYRLQTAGNLLRRFYFEHSGSSGPTRTADAIGASSGPTRAADPTAAPSGPARSSGRPAAGSSGPTPNAGPAAAST